MSGEAQVTTMMNEQQMCNLITDWVTVAINGEPAAAIQALLEIAMTAQEKKLSGKELYWIGVKQGVERHSFWRDGVRYVGAGVVTLAQAMQQVDKEMKEALK